MTLKSNKKPKIMNAIKHVALKDAVLTWTPTHWPSGGKGSVKVIPLAELRAGTDRGLVCTACACRSAWASMTKNERLLQLYIEAWHLIARDGVTPESVHDALSVVPEYVNTLTGENLFEQDT